MAGIFLRSEKIAELTEQKAYQTGLAGRILFLKASVIDAREAPIFFRYCISFFTHLLFMKCA